MSELFVILGVIGGLGIVGYMLFTMQRTCKFCGSKFLSNKELTSHKKGYCSIKCVELAENETKNDKE